MLTTTASILIWWRIGPAELYLKATYHIRAAVATIVQTNVIIFQVLSLPTKEFECPESVAAIPATPTQIKIAIVNSVLTVSAHPRRFTAGADFEVISTSVSGLVDS